MELCDKCAQFGLSLKANYKPTDFIYGKKNSLVWIIGLNPATPQDEKQYQAELNRTPSSLENYFIGPNIYSYYKDFGKVSKVLFELHGKELGVAHTEIVKCHSKQFPPKGCTGRQTKIIINNCLPFLRQQLRMYQPRLIICNGADVCTAIKETIKPSSPIEKTITSYESYFEGIRIRVILSGFIGRIDDYSKRRLGIEIEEHLKQINI